VCAGLMTCGGVLAWWLIPERLTAHTPVKTFCDPCSPPVHPADRSRALQREDETT
jgi:hypothetical protein